MLLVKECKLIVWRKLWNELLDKTVFGVAFSSLPSISSHDKLQIMTSRAAALPSHCYTNKNLPFDKQGRGHQHIRAAIPTPIPCSPPSQLRNHTAMFSRVSITSPAVLHLWVNTYHLHKILPSKMNLWHRTNHQHQGIAVPANISKRLWSNNFLGAAFLITAKTWYCYTLCTMSYLMHTVKNLRSRGRNTDFSHRPAWMFQSFNSSSVFTNNVFTDTNTEVDYSQNVSSTNTFYPVSQGNNLAWNRTGRQTTI